MAHLKGQSKKLVSRVRRIQGQLDGVVRGLEEDQDCSKILQTVASCRGAFSGLIQELIDGHIEQHILEAEDLQAARKESRELSKILRSYLR